MKSIKHLTLTLLSFIACLTLTAQTITLHSDNTWKTATTLQTNWNQPAPTFNDAAWGNAVTSPFSSCTGYNTPGSNTSTLGTVMWSGAAANTGSNQYFRKHFTLPSTANVSDATIAFTADDFGHIYLNGNALGGLVGAVSNGVVTYTYATIKPFLVCGDNVIAIDAQDNPGACYWAYCDMKITLACGLSSTTCATGNTVPKVDPVNPANLTCSQITDNATTVGIASSANSYYLYNTAAVRNDSKLFVDGSGIGSYAHVMIKGNTSSSNFPTLGFGLNNGTKTILGASLTGLITNSGAGTETMDLTFSTKPTGNVAQVENMRITSAGKVGIGMTTPNGKVDIYKAPTLADANCIALNVHCADKASGAFPGATAIFGNADYNNDFSNCGVSGVATLAALNTGVAGTATTATNASANFGVWGTAGGATTNYGVYGAVTTGANGRPSNCAGYFDGDVLTSSGNFLVSDEKFKTNVKPFTKSLDMLKKLQPKTYDFKVEEYKDIMNLSDGNQVGIMAQNLQAVFPSLVKEKVAPVRYNPVTHEQTGKETHFLAVNYVGLIPVLVEGMKELSSDLDQAKKENADLRNMINDLCSNGCAGLRGGGTIDPSSAPNQLLQNVPNPFSGETTIGYVLNTGTTANMNINALDGKMVRQIPLTVKGQGTVTINGNEFGAGTYTYTLYVDGKVIDTKLMVISATK